MSVLIAGKIALEGVAADGWVETDGLAIVSAGHGTPPREPDERAAGLLSAGLVDLQVNGAAGHEVTGDDDALDAIEAALLARGVTSWLPTLITTDDASADRAVEALARRAADPASTIAGIHLEGPYLSPEHPGMHRRSLLRTPADGVASYLRHPAVRLVTLAPELPGALELIAELATAGVTVSLGHSGADAATAERATEAGARMVTHLFNAMAPLGHRAPGLAGFALTDDRLAVGVIADGAHIDPRMLELVNRLAGPRVVLVSDASPAAAAAAPVSTFAGVALDAGGRLGGRPAGSLCLLDEDVRRWAGLPGVSFPAALRKATEAPAALAGIQTPLAPGAPANLVEWDATSGVGRVMHSGRWRPV